jgi:hypothetical protein
MSDSDSEVLPLGDPNPTRLLETVADKLDAVLVANGFQFSEDKDWAVACEELQDFIFKFYDDLTGGDSDYDPKKPALVDSDEVEVEGDVSSDEDEEDEDEECESSPDHEAPAPKKRSRK